MPFQVDVVSPEAVVWSGEADFLVARTTEGEIGILTDHEPVMAALATGAVIIESGNDRTTVGVHGGFLQVLRNQVTLLTDRAEIATGGREGAAELAAELRQVEEEQAEEEQAEEERAEQQQTEQQQT
jgi:F-type H+-transporting ATPase subunit epsilon